MDHKFRNNMDSLDVEIIRKERGNLLRRIMMRSPMLRFAPGKGAHGNLDVYNLFVGEVSDNHSILEEETPSQAVEKLTTLLKTGVHSESERVQVEGVNKPIASRCLRLSALNLDHYRTTGNWSLYLGYPILYWKLQEDRKAYWAPLYFWKVAMQLDGRTLYLFRPDEENPLLRSKNNKDPETPKYNPFLRSFIKREINLSIELQADNVDSTAISSKVAQLSREWNDCDISNFTNQLMPYKLPADGNGPAIYPFATIGRGSFQGESIAEDLDALCELKDLSTETGCLEYLLLRPVDKTAEEDANATISPAEVDKYTVTKSDPSQEQILWNTAQSGVTIIKGPPGTGKSQTIVNLISSALARKEKIVVACHQDAALSVVKKRLDECNLGDLAIKINDPARDRTRIIRSIRNLRAGFRPTRSVDAIASARAKHSEEILQSEHFLEHAHQKLRGAPLTKESASGELRSILYKINKGTGFNPYTPKYSQFVANSELVGRKNMTEANVVTRIIEQHIEDMLACDYYTNPWRSICDLTVDKNKLRGGLEEIQSLLEKFNIPESGMHSQNEIWYAEHPWLRHYYAGFTESAVEQAQYSEILSKVHTHLSGVIDGASFSKFLRMLREGACLEELSQYLQRLDSLETLVDVKELQRDSPLVQALNALEDINYRNWAKCCQAAIAYNLLTSRGAIPGPRSIERNLEQIRAALSNKADADYEHICSNFTKRSGAAAELQQQGLLMLRRGRRPKTELRTLYHTAYSSLSNIYPVLLTNFDAACKLLPLLPDLVDTLIIDEASQVYTSDAMALLYRAKRTFISGDDMQMPPSYFFESSDSDEQVDDEEEKGSEQSLLHSLESAIPTNSRNYRELNVHYRSSFRELIQFSNYAFYEGRLLTPPTNRPPLSFWKAPITLLPLSGKFEDGVNLEEIQQVIDELTKIWNEDPSKYSVGVIVANTRQRDKLEQTLDDIASMDHSFKRSLEISRELEKGGLYEGFFVRSIENVQGDERDIIIYSTTYGQESRRFGPLSHMDKGRKRLNVAITRAKLAMVVITSLDIQHISNPTESAHNGAGKAKERWFLWKFLRYAQAVSDGDVDLAANLLSDLTQTTSTPNLRDTSSQPENGFEKSVGEFLHDNEYHIEYQIGESGFRIDIGVKAQKTDKEYICGVECDGAAYHSGWLARHRDAWRQGVLEDKGWKIARVWSTHWFDEAGAIAARNTLLEQVKRFQTASHANSE